MSHDHENIFRKQEELRILKQQLQTQVVALQNNSAQTKGDPEINRSPDLYALDVLIQKRIVKVKMPHHNPNYPNPRFSLSKEIQECEFPRKFLTPTFDYYYNASPSRVWGRYCDVHIHGRNTPPLSLSHTHALSISMSKNQSTEAPW